MTEEWLLGDYDVDALKVVGLEGMWGCIYWIIILPILRFVKVPKNDLFPRGVVEDTLFAFEQMGDKPFLIVMNFAIIISMGFTNGLGCIITKNGSSA